MRIGQGFDVHRFTPERPLVLGGITIKDHQGLLGHSDADVLTHALIDALLGAIGETDIGTHFPPGKTETKNISSITLLKKIMQLVIQKSFSLVNADCTIICETPKIKPYVSEMRKLLAQQLHCSSAQITIKGKTTEKLGFTGRKEGIAAMVVVLLEKQK